MLCILNNCGRKPNCYGHPMRLTVEVEIDHGRIVAREPEKLPERGRGLLTITSTAETTTEKRSGKRVQLPLIRGDGRRMINPNSDQLDDSLWDD
jgi:hypothetical protein